MLKIGIIGFGRIGKVHARSIQTMKEYERTAVRAILNRDRDLAIKALLINPLVANLDLAEKIVGAFLMEVQKEGQPPWK